MKGRYIAGWLVILCFIVISAVGCSKGSSPDVKDESVKSAIKAYIDQNSSAHDGWFIITDSNKGSQKLKFDYIHEGVNKHGEHYVSCVDFTDEENNSFDVDFHVSNKGGQLGVESVTIHKEKGKKQ